jgi:hypothetical protein
VVPAFQPAFTHLECFDCHATCDPSTPRAVCPTCGRPLVARYDLARIRTEVPRASLGRFGTDLWRYRFVLPFAPSFPAVRLGEGGTPLLPLPRLAEDLGLDALWLKAEAGNPTSSFKARGLVMAVNGALAWGRRGIALPSAGNAGSAAAAHAAAAGLPCRVAIPDDTPEAFQLELAAFGAEVRLVKGTIADCGKVVAEWAPAPEWWNVATLQGPFRLEGEQVARLRDRRAARLAAARRHPVPDRRWHRARRHGEGVRRDGGARLDRRRATVWWRCRSAAARRSCARSRLARRGPNRGSMRTRSRAGCACRRRSPTRSSSMRSAARRAPRCR